ncbi:hypothetical protein GIB67_020309, partial [Kingdonia uniflora]
MNADDIQVPLARVDYPWDGEAIPSYDVSISLVREPTPGSTSRSRTPAPQSNRRRSAAAVQPLEPTELVQSLISAFTAQGASHTSGSNDDTSDAVVQILQEMVLSVQLINDLLSMLVAGHEITGSVLTRTLYLLSKDASSLIRVQEEVDRVLQGRLPTYEDMKQLKYLIRFINESMCLYPHPLYTISIAPHRSGKEQKSVPERFNLDRPMLNETNTDCRVSYETKSTECSTCICAILSVTSFTSYTPKNLNRKFLKYQDVNCKSFEWLSDAVGQAKSSGGSSSSGVTSCFGCGGNTHWDALEEANREESMKNLNINVKVTVEMGLDDFIKDFKGKTT